MTAVREWIIGRAPECDLTIAGTEVSARHCRLPLSATGYLLEDLQSSNGTFVNGRRVTAPVPVTPRDHVTLGPHVPMPWPTGAAAAAPVVRVGRAADNDVVLDYPMVSAYHAHIVREGDTTRIEDLGSTNGTALGRPDRKVTQAPLSAADTVYFGSLPVPAARLLAGGLALGAGPHTTVTVAGSALVLGRDPRCDQVLDSPLVSARHARLSRGPDGFVLEDLGSTNGTFVNGRRVTGALPIRPGDVIGLAGYTFTLTAAGELEKRDYHGNICLEARGVTVEVPGRRLIEDVSLTIYPSEFVGLMGPSGAGKTTLMNALNGYTPPRAGDVFLNGQSLYAQFDQFRACLGYVPQDDVMHADLTVGQALYYSARLRLPADFSREELRDRIARVMKQLGLEGTEDVLIGSAEKKGISGGQRKRVNLAMELLTDPLVLFLDEPTSGLSSDDALTVMKVLRQLADDGKTILLTIHQPSLEVFRLMDNLVLMAKDPGARDPGRLAYYGPAYPDAVEFFNPDGVAGLKPGTEPAPEEVMRGLARGKAAEWGARYRESRYQREYVAERAGDGTAGRAGAASPGKPRTAPLRQWATLVARTLAIKVRDRVNTGILLAQAPLVGLLVVLVFGGTVSRSLTNDLPPDEVAATSASVGVALFLLVLAALWFGASAAVREIVGEWAVYRRERMVNLKVPAYVASKFTVLGGMCVVQCAVLLGIAHWGCGMRGPWLPMFGLLLLSAFVGIAVGLVLSALARTSESAISILPVLLLALVVLGGMMKPIGTIDSAPGRAVCWAVPTRWAFEGMLLLESDSRPVYEPPFLYQMVALFTGRSEMAMPRDLAEAYFPRDKYRFGVPAAFGGLGVLLVVLAALVHLILRRRDVH